jgi:hypothetical protein
MTRNRKRGGPGRGRGFPAPRSPRSPDSQGSQGSRGSSSPVGPLGADELREHLRRSVEDAAREPRSFDVVVTGTLSHAEVETHPLILTDESGEVWELILPPSWSVDPAPGARVTVSGDTVDEQSTTQVGPRLRVRSLSRAD